MANLRAPPRPTADAVRVVGIGASAGGVPALQALFQELPARPGAALVIVQHTTAGRSSALVEIVARCTRMRVAEAVDGLAPERDCVYVIAPGDVLTLEGGVFRARRRGDRRRAGIDTVDAFFESLAEDRGRDAVAVVLSGTGSDGAAGAVVVRDAGGVVLVQDPSTAAYVGMPLAVIACDVADRVGPVLEIARDIVASASPDWARATPEATRSSRKTFDAIRALMGAQSGVDLRAYKPTPQLHRIHHRMRSRGVRAVSDYQTLLRDEPTELDTLMGNFLVHVTGFFRDPEAWSVLERDVLPAVLRARRGAPVRAWTAACATGEEAYSLAMLLSEQALDFRVFATDVAPDVVARASHGAFSEKAMRAVGPERRARFFDAEDGQWRVKASLREKVIFARHDLLADPPFGALDLVTCRNLLIYLEAKTTERVLRTLRGALRADGHLFLGEGEPLSASRPGFSTSSASAHIYKKVPDAAPADARAELAASREEIQAVNVELNASHQQLDSANAELEQSNAALRAKIAELEMQKNVLASCAVATLFLDEELRVRWFTPAVAELFPLRVHDTGRPIEDLVPKFDDASFVGKARAVMRSGAEHETELRTHDGRCYLLRVRPYRSPDASARGVAMTFTDITERKLAAEALRASERRLARELADAKRLQAISSLILEHGDASALDQELVAAAAALMQSDAASLQRLDPERRELHLLAWKGFHPASAAFWARLSCDQGTTCGIASSRGERLIVPDVFAEEMLEGSEHLEHFRLSGIVAVQSTPLVARDGRVVGMMSTHWGRRHEPSERDLALFDVVARQAADVLELRRQVGNTILR